MLGTIMQPPGRNEPDLLLLMCCELCDVHLRAKAKLQRNMYLTIPLEDRQHNPQLMCSTPAHICMCTGRLWEDSDPGYYSSYSAGREDRRACFSLSFVWLSTISPMALSMQNVYKLWLRQVLKTSYGTSRLFPSTASLTFLVPLSFMSPLQDKKGHFLLRGVCLLCHSTFGMPDS